MNKFSVEHYGQKYHVISEEIGNTIWFHVEGQTFAIELKNKSKKRGGREGEATGDVMAPMPGKITKILVNEGQNIESGQIVVVMEAMKMEYSLKAGVGGVVKKMPSLRWTLSEANVSEPPMNMGAHERSE
jgi:acetyl/propionyl-CoA carboxylase alpha subunit